MTESISPQEVRFGHAIEELREFAGPEWEVRPGRNLLSFHYPTRQEAQERRTPHRFNIYLSHIPGRSATLTIKLAEVFKFKTEVDPNIELKEQELGEEFQGKRLLIEGVMTINFDNMVLDLNKDGLNEQLDIDSLIRMANEPRPRFKGYNK